jgi:pre-rRNA-processing protein TSR4
MELSAHEQKLMDKYKTEEAAMTVEERKKDKNDWNEELEEPEQTGMKNNHDDPFFLAFSVTTSFNPEQVLRYYKVTDAKPLWYHRGDRLTTAVPVCPHCQSVRYLEFQITTQLLNFLGQDPLAETALDFGVINIYSCSQSCVVEGYASEYVYAQPAKELKSTPGLYAPVVPKNTTTTTTTTATATTAKPATVVEVVEEGEETTTAAAAAAAASTAE